MDKALLEIKFWTIKNTYFKLRNPAIIVINKNKKFNSNYAAMYNSGYYELNNKDKKLHIIEIGESNLSDYSFCIELMAHELCHAEQYEKNHKTLNHTKAFFKKLDTIMLSEGLQPISKEYKKISQKMDKLC